MGSLWEEYLPLLEHSGASPGAITKLPKPYAAATTSETHEADPLLCCSTYGEQGLAISKRTLLQVAVVSIGNLQVSAPVPISYK